jgi:hypothetical protein
MLKFLTGTPCSLRCVYVYIYEYMYVNTHIYMHNFEVCGFNLGKHKGAPCSLRCVYVYIYEYIYVNTHIYMHNFEDCGFVYACMFMCICIHINIHRCHTLHTPKDISCGSVNNFRGQEPGLCMYVCMCVCMYVCLYVYMYPYQYT